LMMRLTMVMLLVLNMIAVQSNYFLTA